MRIKGTKRRATGRFFSIVLGIVIVYAAVILVKQFKEIHALKVEQDALIAQISETEMRRDKLKYLIQSAQTDTYIESVARDKLGWVKPTETRYVIRDGE